MLQRAPKLGHKNWSTKIAVEHGVAWVGSERSSIGGPIQRGRDTVEAEEGAEKRRSNA